MVSFFPLKLPDLLQVADQIAVAEAARNPTGGPSSPTSILLRPTGTASE